MPQTSAFKIQKQFSTEVNFDHAELKIGRHDRNEINYGMHLN